MSLQVFNVGDIVEYKDEVIHLKATITSIEDSYPEPTKLWGIWKDQINPECRDISGFCWADSNVTLIEQLVMQYDPTQQGDTEDDI